MDYLLTSMLTFWSSRWSELLSIPMYLVCVDYSGNVCMKRALTMNDYCIRHLKPWGIQRNRPLKTGYIFITV